MTATSGILPGVSAGVLGDSTTELGVVGISSASVGVYGASVGSSDIGVVPAGVPGDSNTNPGVVGQSSTMAGVAGLTSGDGQAGVFGEDASEASFSFGVVGLSENGISIQAHGGLAPLQPLPSAAAVAPTTGAHFIGEMYVDSNGVFYKCVVAGSPGT